MGSAKITICFATWKPLPRYVLIGQVLSPGPTLTVSPIKPRGGAVPQHRTMNGCQQCTEAWSCSCSSNSTVTLGLYWDKLLQAVRWGCAAPGWAQAWCVWCQNISVTPSQSCLLTDSLKVTLGLASRMNQAAHCTRMHTVVIPGACWVSREAEYGRSVLWRNQGKEITQC